MIKSEILVPLLNANEPEARLVGVHVRDGQTVEPGTILFTLETTKAAADIESPAGGCVRLLAAEGAVLAVGDRLAVIAESADETVEIAGEGEARLAPTELRITRPARLLAESLGLDPASLPTDRLVTEALVRQLAGAAEPEIVFPASDLPGLLVYGAGGHAKSVMEMALQMRAFDIVGIVDDNPSLAGTSVLGMRVLGTRRVLPLLKEKGVALAANGVGGIVDIDVRVRLFDLLERSGFACPALVHPRATIEPSAQVGQGAQVFAGAYVGSQARLSPKCMINTNAVVSHDCEIGSYSHIAPGALLAGHVHVGGRTLVGMGVSVHIGVRIGDRARIGNGAIVLADVPDRAIVQAGRFWTGKMD